MIFELLKNRKAIRNYSQKEIPRKDIDTILKAGLWGPSVTNFQPWNFVVIQQKKVITTIATLVSKKTSKMDMPNFIRCPSLKALASSTTMICVFNTNRFAKYASIFNKEFVKQATVAEISAISAAIQNMILVAESLKIGSCWLDTPVFCKKKIGRLLDVTDELIAILTLGYPAEKGRRSPRRVISKVVRYIA